MSFASSGYLWALFAVAIPLLLHYFLRDRIQRVDFPTLRFFAKGARTVLRKRSMREAVLMALRALLVLFLVLAFARPHLGPSSSDEGQGVERVRVLVLDHSASMLPHTDWLQTSAEQALAEMNNGADAVAIVSIGAQVRQVLGPTTDHNAVKLALAELRPGQGGTDLVKALRKADEILANVKAREKSIVLLSDLQRYAWMAYRGDWKLAHGVSLITEVPPKIETKNSIVIVDADAPGNIALDGVPRAVSLRLRNNGLEAQSNVQVMLKIDNLEVDQRSVDLPAAATGTLRFRATFSEPGEHLCEVLVQDGVDEASHFRFIVRVMARVPVAVIGDPVGETDANAAFFTKLALAPDEFSPFIVEEIVNGAQGDASMLDRFRVAIITDTKIISPAVKTGLKGILERGGGLCFFPGAGTDAETFRSSFADLAPCRLQRIISEDPATPQAIAGIDFTHPAFEIFSHPHWGDLAAPHFIRYWEVADVQGASIPLRLANGRPLMVQRNMGSGISMLMVSAPDPQWNDLPFQSVFLPLLHQSIRHLAVRGLPPTTLTVGDALPGTMESKVTRPDGSVVLMSATMSDEPGFYSTQLAEEAPVKVAVNRAFEESSLECVEAEQLGAVLQQSESGAVQSGGRQLERGDDSSVIWWWIALAAALLTLIELTLGNKAQRH